MRPIISTSTVGAELVRLAAPFWAHYRLRGSRFSRSLLPVTNAGSPTPSGRGTIEVRYMRRSLSLQNSASANRNIESGRCDQLALAAEFNASAHREPPKWPDKASTVRKTMSGERQKALQTTR
jgi:hypothetical protein